jgi:hypothetical protein
VAMRYEPGRNLVSASVPPSACVSRPSIPERACSSKPVGVSIPA